VSFPALALGLLILTVLVLLLRSALGPGEAPKSPSPSPSRGGQVANGVPDCREGAALTEQIDLAAWDRTLVDPHFILPSSYLPTDLVPVAKAGFTGDFQVRRLLLKDLRALHDAATGEQVDLGIVAAHRDYATQQQLFADRVAQLGKEEAEARTAKPGHSEHQLGTAIDFRTGSASDVDQRWERTPEGAWMAEHAATYGFVMSYPKGQEDVSCYEYEPWHYRYFGTERAAAINASGLSVREFLWAEQVGAQ